MLFITVPPLYYVGAYHFDLFRCLHQHDLMITNDNKPSCFCTLSVLRLCGHEGCKSLILCGFSGTEKHFLIPAETVSFGFRFYCPLRTCGFSSRLAHQEEGAVKKVPFFYAFRVSWPLPTLSRSKTMCLPQMLVSVALPEAADKLVK